jgi:uncharacterized membrane protein
MSVLRLVTVHPALVHSTLGLIPLFLLMYWLAAARSSERWTLVGDITLVFCAAVTFLTFAFGLISNFALNWPGGLHRWRWLHLLGGALTLVTLLALAVARLRARRRGRVTTGLGVAGFSAVIAVVAAYTGWIGGEILVYHAGMAVEAAADGSLAPPVSKGVEGNPNGLMDGMHAIRASWAEMETSLAYVLVHHPADANWNRMSVASRRLEGLAAWLATPAVVQSIDPHSPEVARRAVGSDEQKAKFVQFSSDLEHAANSVRLALDRRDLEAASREVGATQSACVGCHAALRWRHPG